MASLIDGSQVVDFDSDYNFDGYNDLTSIWNAGAGYSAIVDKLIFLFNPNKNIFEFSKELSEINNLNIDNNRLFSSMCVYLPDEDEVVCGKTEYIWFDDGRVIKKDAENIQPIENKKDNNTTMNYKKFENDYLSFEYPSSPNISVEKDDDYGYVYISETDDENEDTVSDVSIVRILYSRDSITRPESFLLEYLPLLDEGVFEEFKIDSNLEYKAFRKKQKIQAEGKNADVVFVVVYYEFEKPINEYFDGIAVSGYYAESVDSTSLESHIKTLNIIFNSIKEK